MAIGPGATTTRDWFDPIAQVIFELHAYLIVVFGDIPAISMVMCIKGHNAISPCHMCDIQGIHIPSSRITTHYVPLNCDHFSGVNPGYQAHSLPVRNHKTFLRQAVEVQTASTTSASERLATKYGIKGLPLLTALTSLSFPLSSVVVALSWHFAILVNKTCKIIKIFEQLDNLRNQWVLCQH